MACNGADSTGQFINSNDEYKKKYNEDFINLLSSVINNTVIDVHISKIDVEIQREKTKQMEIELELKKIELETLKLQMKL